MKLTKRQAFKMETLMDLMISFLIKKRCKKVDVVHRSRKILGWDITNQPHLVHLVIFLPLFPSFQSYQLARYCSRNNAGCRYCIWKFFNNCSAIPRFSSSQFDSFQLNETILFSSVLLLLNFYFIVYVTFTFNDLML